MLLVAHRTPSTRAGCARLAAAGARVFEADVQVDARDRVVVSHYLPMGRAGLLHRDNWRIRWHRAALRDPTLADVSAVVPDDCLVLLDLKGRARPSRDRLCDVLIDGLPDRERYRVCSAHPGELARLRSAGFRTWRTVGTGPELRAVVATELPDEAITVRHTLLTVDAIAQLHRIVPSVVAWTVNDPRRAARLRAMGADGITTDSERVMREWTSNFH